MDEDDLSTKQRETVHTMTRSSSSITEYRVFVAQIVHEAFTLDRSLLTKTCEKTASIANTLASEGSKAIYILWVEFIDLPFGDF